MKTALIVGATGAVGRHCLSLLLEDSDYDQITVISRKPLSLKNQKLRSVKVDFEQLDSVEDEAFKVNDVYCCLGTTMSKAGSKEAFRRVDYEYPIKIAQLSKQQGASRYFLISAIGADANSKIFYNRTKGELESSLKDLNFESYIVFRPSLLIGEREGFRLSEFMAGLLLKLIGVFLLGPLSKYRSVRTETVAKAMIEFGKKGLSGTHVIESDQIRSVEKKTH